MAMRALLAQFRGSVTLAFCQPCPFDRNAEARDSQRPDSQSRDPRFANRSPAEGVRVLARYWERAGFKRLGRGPFYYVRM
jgi:hypothetical protein